MSRLLNVLRSKRQNGRVVIIPHLYFTYLFISLLSSACYHLLGRDVLVMLFSWYYINGIDTFLLMLAIIEYVVRVVLINKKQLL